MAEHRTDEEQTEGITQEEQIAAYSRVYSVKGNDIRRRRRSPKMKRMGETRKELAGQFEDKAEQVAYARHAHKCPTVREEPVKLSPTDHELTPAQREELGISDVIAPEPIVNEGLPPTTQPHSALTLKPMCTCGTLTTCIAHD